MLSRAYKPLAAGGSALDLNILHQAQRELEARCLVQVLEQCLGSTAIRLAIDVEAIRSHHLTKEKRCRANGLYLCGGNPIRNALCGASFALGSYGRFWLILPIMEPETPAASGFPELSARSVPQILKALGASEAPGAPNLSQHDRLVALAVMKLSGEWHHACSWLSNRERGKVAILECLLEHYPRASFARRVLGNVGERFYRDGLAMQGTWLRKRQSPLHPDEWAERYGAFQKGCNALERLIAENCDGRGS